MWWVTSWDELVSRDLCIYVQLPRCVARGRFPQNSRSFPLEVAEPYGEFKLRKLENWSWRALPASDGVLFQHHLPFQCRYFDMCGAASPHVVSAYWCSWAACCLLWLWCWLKNKEGNFPGYLNRQPSESLIRKYDSVPASGPARAQTGLLD